MNIVVPGWKFDGGAGSEPAGVASQSVGALQGVWCLIVCLVPGAKQFVCRVHDVLLALAV